MVRISTILIAVILSAASAPRPRITLRSCTKRSWSSLMSFGNLSSRIGRGGASNRSGVYDGRMMRTMRSVGAFKTSTASAEQSFWPYGNDLPPVSWTDLCWKTPV